MTDFAKQLLAIGVVGFLLVVPATSGDANSKQSEAVSRKDAKTALSGDQISKIESTITAFRSRLSIPAISVAIVRDNQIVVRRGYGLADLENQVPATAVTVFRIASVAKSLTAVAAMQLAEKGKLDLDAPIQKYAPSFPTKAFPITTRQLLAHLSGVRGYRSGEGERTYHYESLTDALAVFKDDPLEHEPGTKYAYTTFGYTCLVWLSKALRECHIQSICGSEFSSRPECCIRRWMTFTKSYRTAHEATRRRSTGNSTAIGVTRR